MTDHHHLKERINSLPPEKQLLLKQKLSERQAALQGQDRADLVAFVRIHDKAAQDDIAPYLKERLPQYMVPSRIVCLESFPRTPNGKLDRGTLQTMAQRAGQTRPTSLREEEYLTETEMRIAAIWKDLLTLDHVSKSVDFFEVGGHSLLAIQLFARIGQEFERPMPVSTLLTHPTIEQQAEFIVNGARPEDRTLITLRATGKHPPLFVAHHRGGDLLRYGPLLEKVNPSIPIMGFEAIGLRGEADPMRSIEAMANRYVSELKQSYPEGPYYLAGFSDGGIIAYEMACQLHNSGERIGGLVMLDPLLQEITDAQDKVAPRSTISRYELIRASLKNDSTRMAGLSLPQKMRFVIQRFFHHMNWQIYQPLKRTLQMYNILPQSDWAPHKRVRNANLMAFKRYRPGDYEGDVLYIRSTDDTIVVDTTAYWQKYIKGAFNVVTFEGQHTALVEQHADQVAALIDSLYTQS